MGAALRAQWPRVNWATFGFKSLGDLIAKECGLDIYRPISAKGTTANASPTVVDGVSASANVIQAETAASLRKALEAVEPAIGYPELISLTSALDELTVRSDAMEPDALLDALGDSLPDVPAEQIRLALGLLYAVGAFRVKDDSSLILTSDIKSAENGIDFILGDARRRAETIEIEPTDSEIEEAVFGR